MTDYTASVYLLRDTMVEMLSDDSNEQTPYVLAELAGFLIPGTRNHDQFLTELGELDSDQCLHLQSFCEAIAVHLKVTEPA
ncbi:hypothetical protein [Roseovarius sp. D0-M9]|uniref:hypothetical protein n=1 Tax=Roseovarius sp. D0-M9 TaxID=3127117 RepID=UPI0030101CAC